MQSVARDSCKADGTDLVDIEALSAQEAALKAAQGKSFLVGKESCRLGGPEGIQCLGKQGWKKHLES